MAHNALMITSDAVALARLATGMSQAAFGALLGVSRRTITRWEAGAGPIPHWLTTGLPDAIARAPAQERRRGRPPAPSWPKRVLPRSHPHLYERVPTSNSGIVYSRNKRHPGYGEKPWHNWLEISPGQYEQGEVSRVITKP